MRHYWIPFLCLITLPSMTYAQGFGGGGGGGKLKIMTRQLDDARADEVISILNELFPVKFSSNKTTNTIYARVSKEQEQEVEAIIDQMEKRTVEVEMDRKKLRGRGGLGGGGLSSLGGGAGNSRSTARSSGRSSGSTLGRSSPKARKSTRTSSGLGRAASALTSDLDLDLSWVERDIMPLVIELSKIETEFGSEHPRVRMMKKQIETVRERVLSSLDASRSERLKSRASAFYAAKHSALETEVSKVAAKLREQKAKDLPEDEIKEIKAGLTESVGKLFDVRQQAEEADLKQFNEQLNKIRKRLDERKKNRDEIIQKRVDDLLADGDAD
jgi:hypothetical protein